MQASQAWEMVPNSSGTEALKLKAPRTPATAITIFMTPACLLRYLLLWYMILSHAALLGVVIWLLARR